MPSLREWFDELAGLEAPERDAALARLRAEAPEMAEQLARLLTAHERRGAFLETPYAPPLEGPEALVGRSIGAWRLSRVLGEGGMGVVFEARREDAVFEKRAALKMARGALLSDRLRERFQNERQILAAMEHPNIARILDGGTDEQGRPYLVMEYVEGVHLMRFAGDHRLGLEARLRLFRQLADAVMFAHRHLVVHRDLKPGNILVDSSGQVKLLDFGIAKILDDPFGAARRGRSARHGAADDAGLREPGADYRASGDDRDGYLPAGRGAL